MSVPTSIPTDDNDLTIAKKELKRFMISTCGFLKLLTDSKVIPVSPIFLDIEDRVNILLKEAFNELKIDYESDLTLDKSRILEILSNIDNLEFSALERVGLIGKNLELKMFVYDSISREFDETRKSLDELPAEKKESWGRKFLNLIWRKKGAINSIGGSLSKLIPLIEPLLEFKDIASQTKKSLDE